MGCFNQLHWPHQDDRFYFVNHTWLVNTANTVMPWLRLHENVVTSIVIEYKETKTWSHLQTLVNFDPQISTFQAAYLVTIQI